MGMDFLGEVLPFFFWGGVIFGFASLGFRVWGLGLGFVGLGFRVSGGIAVGEVQSLWIRSFRGSLV